MCAHVLHVYNAIAAREGVKFLENGSLLLYGLWEQNLGPLQEQVMLLTMEPSLQLK